LWSSPVAVGPWAALLYMHTLATITGRVH
jgi:hypothetical protein